MTANTATANGRPILTPVLASGPPAGPLGAPAPGAGAAELVGAACWAAPDDDESPAAVELLASALGLAFGSPLTSELALAVGVAVASAVGLAFGSAFASALGLAFGSALASAAGLSAGAALASAAGLSAGAALGSAEGLAVASALGFAVASALGVGTLREAYIPANFRSSTFSPIVTF